AIQWSSPEGDWDHFDLGDFNNDGDLEIVVAGNVGDGDTGKIAIYDPVVSQGGSDTEINGIPWTKLYEAQINDGAAYLVNAGNFDDGIPGDEIMYVVELRDSVKEDEADVAGTRIIKPTSLTPDGRSWITHIDRKDFDFEINQIASGNIDLVSHDEVAIIGEDKGKLTLYKLDDGFRQIFKESSSSDPLRSAAIGQVFAGGTMELVATRKMRAGRIGRTMIIYSYDNENDTMVESDGDAFSPYPRKSILADVNGSGDQEVIMLRRDNNPRLIMRNFGNDGTIAFEQDLDDDDQYRNGAAGDIDGDGFDELVISRPNKLRVYTSLNANADYDEYNVDNKRYVNVGDLDKVGFVRGAEFQASIELIERSIEADQQDATLRFDLINATTTDRIDFKLFVDGYSNWIDVSASQFSTPASIFVTFNSFGLLPGTYNSKLVISSTTPDLEVINAIYVVNMVFTVIPAELTISHARLHLSASPCTIGRDGTEMAVQQRKIEITGSNNSTLRYTAAILDAPSVQAAQNSLNGTLVSGQVNEAGDVVLIDSAGTQSIVNNTGLPSRATAQSAQVAPRSGNAGIEWPSAKVWASASSDLGIVNDNLTVRIDPNLMESANFFDKAILVIVAEERAGARPNNVRLVDMSLLCSQSQMLLPVVTR
ncbi:MAG: VCBS repeat-containing protein, partial [Chloroflexota bacterium]